MPTTVTPMPTTQLAPNQQEIYDWLRDEAERIGLHVTMLPEKASLQNGWLYLPMHIDGVVDAYDNALKLQQLEDSWNDRDPQPELPLFLVPEKDPLRQAVWERVANALQRKLKAVDAFGKATNQEEQEKAAAEFRDAEQAENEAHRAYEQIMPWNERVP